MINWMNENKGLNLICSPIDTSNILNNSWLSGFINAEGSFNIRVSLMILGALKNRVAAQFRIEQSIIDSKSQLTYFGLFSIIATSLLVNLTFSTHNKSVKYFLINLSSEKSRIIMINYLNKYPLFSSKFLNYESWHSCHNLMINKDHLTAEGINHALPLKSSMNSKKKRV